MYNFKEKNDSESNSILDLIVANIANHVTVKRVTVFEQILFSILTKLLFHAASKLASLKENVLIIVPTQFSSHSSFWGISTVDDGLGSYLCCFLGFFKIFMYCLT